jgi:hypothetical protein
MSKNMKIIEPSKVNKKGLQGSQTSLLQVRKTRISRPDGEAQQNSNCAKPGTLMLQTALFTLVFVPPSHKKEE